MKIQDLPQPYRALAEIRREQQINSELVKKCEKYFKETNELHLAFYWENTPEGGDWWKDLNEGNTPEIPAESLAELKEWQKEHTEYNAVLIAEQPKAELSGTLATCSKPDPRLFTAAVAAMQGMLANPNYMTEYKGEKYLLECNVVSKVAFDYAKSLINEGKKRNLL